MKKNVFRFLMVFALIAITNIAYSQENKYEIQITVPERDGMQIGKSLDVEGKALIPEGEFLWVLVHRVKGFNYVWYPQGEGEINSENKEWEVTVNFGELQDIGYEFEIAVIVVNDMEHRKLFKYMEDAMTSGDWKPIKMPPTQTAPIYRKKLKKVSH